MSPNAGGGGSCGVSTEVQVASHILTSILKLSRFADYKKEFFGGFLDPFCDAFTKASCWNIGAHFPGFLSSILQLTAKLKLTS